MKYKNIEMSIKESKKYIKKLTLDGVRILFWEENTTNFLGNTNNENCKRTAHAYVGDKKVFFDFT